MCGLVLSCCKTYNRSFVTIFYKSEPSPRLSQYVIAYIFPLTGTSWFKIQIAFSTYTEQLLRTSAPFLLKMFKFCPYVFCFNFWHCWNPEICRLLKASTRVTTRHHASARDITYKVDEESKITSFIFLYENNIKKLYILQKYAYDIHKNIRICCILFSFLYSFLKWYNCCSKSNQTFNLSLETIDWFKDSYLTSRFNVSLFYIIFIQILTLN